MFTYTYERQDIIQIAFKRLPGGGRAVKKRLSDLALALNRLKLILHLPTLISLISISLSGVGTTCFLSCCDRLFKYNVYSKYASLPRFQIDFC
jgi:hypothetical protein